MSRRKFSKVIPFTLALSLVLGSVPTLTYANGTNSFTVVHTNDVHSRVDIEPIVKTVADSTDNVLLLSAGDALHGQTIATLSQGDANIAIMNAVGYDYLVPGNHDFNYGLARLLELRDEAEFNFLASNIEYKKDGSNVFELGQVVEINGVKVGIFGLATPETATKTNPKNVEDITFTNPVEAARKEVATLKDAGAEYIIVLSHLGMDESSEFTSVLLADEVDGIDLIVDGHSHHELAEGVVVNGTTIVQTGEYGANVGYVDVDATTGEEDVRLVAKKDADGNANAEYVADEEVVALITDMNAANEVITSEVIASTPVVLQGERADVRTHETNLGNLITGAMLEETGADLAITNGGGIRASIDAGDITVGEVVTVLPFGNYIITLELTGNEIVQALEHGVDSVPEAAGHFSHVAGITFKYDPSQPVGSRVFDIKNADGSDFDLNAKYIVATNDFMAAGGDGYTMFDASKTIYSFSALDEALISYLQDGANISEEVRGNMVEGTKPATVIIPSEHTKPAVRPAKPSNLLIDRSPLGGIFN